MRVYHDRLDYVQPMKDESFQIYSTLYYGDDFLLGHYPSGNLLTFNDESRSFLSIEPPIGKQDCSSKNEREAQSLSIWGGEVAIGMWPFGEIWTGYPGDDWKLQARLFSNSPCGVAPYSEISEKFGFVYNALGQRITDMLPLGNGLIVSTSNKQPEPIVSGALKHLDHVSRAEYGRVVMLEKHYDLTCPVEWEKLNDFRIQITRRKINIFHNGNILCTRDFDFSETKGLSGITSFGKGLYGNFASWRKDARDSLKKSPNASNPN